MFYATIGLLVILMFGFGWFTYMAYRMPKYRGLMIFSPNVRIVLIVLGLVAVVVGFILMQSSQREGITVLAGGLFCIVYGVMGYYAT